MYAAQYGAVPQELETMFSCILSGMLRQGRVMPHIPVAGKMLFDVNTPVRAVIGGSLHEMEPEHAYQLRGRMEEVAKLAGLMVEETEVAGLRAKNPAELEKGLVKLGETLQKRPDLAGKLLHEEDRQWALDAYARFKEQEKAKGAVRA